MHSASPRCSLRHCCLAFPADLTRCSFLHSSSSSSPPPAFLAAIFLAIFSFLSSSVSLVALYLLCSYVSLPERAASLCPKRPFSFPSRALVGSARMAACALVYICSMSSGLILAAT